MRSRAVELGNLLKVRACVESRKRADLKFCDLKITQVAGCIIWQTARSYCTVGHGSGSAWTETRCISYSLMFSRIPITDFDMTTKHILNNVCYQVIERKVRHIPHLQVRILLFKSEQISYFIIIIMSYL